MSKQLHDLYTNTLEESNDTATCIGLIVKKSKSQLLISFSIIVHSTSYEFYIIGLRMTELCQNMWM
jgi:hypothetical protein